MGLNKVDISNQKNRANLAIGLIDNKSRKVLELGTGNGELFLELIKRNFDVTGTDIDIRKHLEKYKIIKHDLNKRLPFKSSTFDVVIGLEVLEHLFNPYKTMKEIRRVLRKEGVAIISMPNSASFFSRIGQLYEKRMDNLDIYWHHHQPSIISIRNLVATQLKIEKEVYIMNFRRLSFLNFLSSFLLKLNRNLFAGDFMVKARKIE